MCVVRMVSLDRTMATKFGTQNLGFTDLGRVRRRKEPKPDDLSIVDNKNTFKSGTIELSAQSPSTLYQCSTQAHPQGQDTPNYTYTHI